MVKYKNITTIIVVIIAAIAALRLVSLGMYPLFDPTEGRYAEIGRKMLETGNWVTPFIEYNVPFWAKPPLSFWLTAISYKIFGVNEFAARLPSFLAMGGILWLIGRILGSRSGGRKEKLTTNHCPLITILILSSMALFFYLAGGVMTDPSLAFGITLSMVSFWRSVVLKQKIWGYAFFAGIAIALLAKGPVGVVLMGMPIFVWVVWQNKWKDLWNNIPWIYGTMLTAILVLPWYIMAENRTPGFLNYFIIGEHFERFINKGWKGDLYGSGRAHPIGTIWWFCFAAMLPWSLIFLAVPFAKNLRESLSINNSPDKSWQIYLWLWALAPLVFFTFARNVLITYVISSLPAFAMLISPYIFHLLQNKAGRIITISAAGFIIIVFSGALIAVNLYPEAKWIKSEDNIIKAYREKSIGKDIPIIYLGKNTYSDEFYLGGKVKNIEEVKELEPYFAQEVYIVVSKNYYFRVFADKNQGILQKKLAIAAQKNDSILLHYLP